MANGDFEADNQLWQCSNTTIFQDPCENDFWLEADIVIPPPCGDPFADADRDGDVDQDDFGAFQQCITGMNNGPVSGDCLCFDRIDSGDSARDDDVDQVDYAAFEACASGPGIPADIACDDNN
ncbi:hypothetical protein GF420_15250 [candidate division GN15 bacterium]|nr:hypothetical protein [candidate division GN15 bacterium]